MKNANGLPNPSRRVLSGLSGLLLLAPFILMAGCAQDSQAILPARMAGGGKISLSWDPVPGAVAYNVYFSTSPGVTALSGVKIANAANPITIRDLHPGKTYYFVVTAVDPGGMESAPSEEVSHAAE